MRYARVVTRTSRAPTLALVAALAACALVDERPERPIELTYRVALREAVLECAVGVDPPTDEPGPWVFDLPPAAPVDVQATVDGATLRLRVTDGLVEVPAGATRLAWRLDLGAQQAAWGADLSTGHLGRVGDRSAALLAGAAWMLRPRPAPREARVTVDGQDALLPWTGDVVGADLLDPGFHLFGGRRLTVEAAGARLDVAAAGRLGATDDQLRAWLAQALREVALVRPKGELPWKRLAVGLAPVAAGEGVPFGLTLFSAPPSLALQVGVDAGEADFVDDWIAVHELLHTVHPRFAEPDDAPLTWLVEGTATYLSILARARSGRWTEAEVWGEALHGVRHGVGVTRGRTLLELAPVMHRDRAYYAIYWGGALLCLDLDAALRDATGDAAGYEDAVARVLAVKPDKAGLEDVVRAVDHLAGRPVARAIVTRHVTRPALEGAEARLAELGVGRGRRRRATIDDDAPQAALRRRLVRLRP